MIWQRVQSGLFPFIQNKFPIAADFTSPLRLSYSEQRLGFFLRFCTNLLQPSKCSLKGKFGALFAGIPFPIFLLTTCWLSNREGHIRTSLWVNEKSVSFL